MAEYIAFDPTVEVRGVMIAAFLLAEGEGVRLILEDLGAANVDPFEWYTQQWALDLLREVGRREGGSRNLVYIGMAIAEQAEFPPHITNVEGALNLIGAIYQLHHRGGKMGYYNVKRIGPQHLTVECCNPYPSDYDYGLIYAITKRFRPRRSTFLVRRDEDTASRTNGDDTCLFHVTWD